MDGKDENTKMLSKLENEIKDLREVIVRQFQNVEKELEKGPEVSTYTLILSIIFGTIVLGVTFIADTYSTSEKVILGSGFVVMGYGGMLIIAIWNKFKKRKLKKLHSKNQKEIHINVKKRSETMDGKEQIKLVNVAGGYLISFVLLFLGYNLIINGVEWDGRLAGASGIALALIIALTSK